VVTQQYQSSTNGAELAAQHRLQRTRLRRLLAEGKRAQTGLLSKVLRRTRRAPEPYRWAANYTQNNQE